MTLGEKLKALRVGKHLTQEQLAKLTHMERRNIWGYENGRNNPSLKTLLILSEQLGCSVNYLIDENADLNGDSVIDEAADRFISVLKTLDYASAMSLMTKVMVSYSAWISDQKDALTEDKETK